MQLAIEFEMTTRNIFEIERLFFCNGCSDRSSENCVISPFSFLQSSCPILEFAELVLRDFCSCRVTHDNGGTRFSHSPSLNIFLNLSAFPPFDSHTNGIAIGTAVERGDISFFDCHDLLISNISLMLSPCEER